MISKKYKLGVYSSKRFVYNLTTRQVEMEYDLALIVSEDVINFLESHDIKLYSNGDRVYKVNEIEYINLGEYGKNAQLI